MDRQVFAEPDGTMTAEVSPEPVRAKNESGDWAPIDLTLEQVDGRLAPKNVPGEVTLSAGGDQAFAKANPPGDGTAQDIVWQWPTTLPEPVIDGPTATYRDVAPGGGDLVVIATTTGFTHNVILHEPPAPGAAPVEFTIPVITPGAEISETPDGGLELKDTDNSAKLITAPTPVMWDSSGTATTDPDVEPVSTTVVDTAAGGNLVLTPSQDFLTDPDTEYPVTIDPSFTQSANGDTWIQNAEYTTSQGPSEELRAGTYDSGSHIARSYLQFPSAPFTGKDIRGASLWIRNHFSKSCTTAAINATRIIEPWSVSNLTWANRPNYTNAEMGQFGAAYGADGCPADGAHWDVTEIVKGWANGTYPNYGLQLRANNETWTATWRKYRSINYADPTVGPRLVVNYNNVPGTVQQLAATPISTAWIGEPGEKVDIAVTRTPSVTASVSEPDADDVRIRVRAYDSPDLTSPLLGECTTSVGSPGTPMGCTLPTLPNSTMVFLRAKAVDVHGGWSGGSLEASSGWSAWAPVAINAPTSDAVDPVVLAIMKLDPGMSEDAITVLAQDMVDEAAISEAPLTMDEARQAILDSYQPPVAEPQTEPVGADPETACLTEPITSPDYCLPASYLVIGETDTLEGADLTVAAVAQAIESGNVAGAEAFVETRGQTMTDQIQETVETLVSEGLPAEASGDPTYHPRSVSSEPTDSAGLSFAAAGVPADSATADFVSKHIKWTTTSANGCTCTSRVVQDVWIGVYVLMPYPGDPVDLLQSWIEVKVLKGRAFKLLDYDCDIVHHRGSWWDTTVASMGACKRFRGQWVTSSYHTGWMKKTYYGSRGGKYHLDFETTIDPDGLFRPKSTTVSTRNWQYPTQGGRPMFP